MNYVIYYLVIINISALLLMKIDKSAARKRRSRISERSLFIIALLGASIGIVIGMYMFNHKTRKRRFKLGLPLILILQIVLILYIINDLQLSLVTYW